MDLGSREARLRLEPIQSFQETAIGLYIDFLKAAFEKYTALTPGKDVHIYPAISQAHLHPERRTMIIVDAGAVQDITPTFKQVGGTDIVEQRYAMLDITLTVHVLSDLELYSQRLATLIFLLTLAHRRELTTSEEVYHIAPRGIGDTIVVFDDTQQPATSKYDVPLTVSVTLTPHYLISKLDSAILNEVKLTITDLNTKIQ